MKSVKPVQQKIIIRVDGKAESMDKIHQDAAPLRQRLQDEEDHFRQRQQELHATEPDETTRGSDASKPANQQHNFQPSPSPLAPKKEFSDKVYLFPEEFNALRKELEENWPTFFGAYHPELKVTLAWAMVFDAPKFIGIMNGALDLDVQLDTENVSGTCKVYLNKLRNMRGISSV